MSPYCKNNYTYHTYDKSSIKCNLVSCTPQYFPTTEEGVPPLHCAKRPAGRSFSIMGSYNKIKKYLNNPQNIRI